MGWDDRLTYEVGYDGWAGIRLFCDATRCNDKGYDTMGWSEMRCDVFEQIKLKQTDETKLQCYGDKQIRKGDLKWPQINVMALNKAHGVLYVVYLYTEVTH